MNLTTDQQKTVYSLIDNSTISGYQEVRDELYDHFISGISDYLKNGMSFTESLNLVYHNLEGQEGMCRIEAGYIEMIKSQGKSLYKKFALQYLRSFRWAAAILLAILITIIPTEFLPVPVRAINFIIHMGAILYGVISFRNWRLAGELGSYYNEKKSLKAVTAYNIYIAPVMVLPILTFFSGHSHGLLLFAISALLYLVVDFSISFINYMKQNWLLPGIKLV